MRKARIAVLIPCYNESSTIGKVVSDCKKNDWGDADVTIYVYNNNSTDDTAQIAKKAGAVVRNEPRQGKGNVVRTMFREIEADCYLMLDGDDTYPIEEATKLCKEVLNSGADMVIGDRLSSTYFKENKRAFHGLGNRLVRGLINTLFHSKIRDMMTGFRAMSRDFVKTFPVLSKGFEIEVEMTAHALDNNFYIVEMPIQYRDRPSGSESKLNTYSDGFKVIMKIIRLFEEYRPMAFFSLISFILFIIALILIIPVFSDYLATGLVARFPTLIVSSIIGLTAILLLVCGLILDVVAKKYRQIFELNLIQLRGDKNDRKGI